VLDDIPSQLALTLQVSFRCWVGLHEELASMEASGKLRELFEQDSNGLVSDSDVRKLHVAKQWAAATVNSRLNGSLHSQNAQEPATLNLRHLKPGDDHNTLSWATEYLAANIAIFRCDASTNSSFMDTIAQHWVEADGGMHTIERRIEDQRLAFAGLPNPSYVLEPVRKASLLDHDLVKRSIEICHLDRLATPSSTGVLDPVEFVQLARLYIATTKNYTFLGFPEDADYAQEHEEWASDYLKRHLLVSEWIDPDVVRDISLADMRTSLRMLLAPPSHSAHSPSEIHDDPPEGIDAELFMPLAWKWSWEYANICIEQHEAGQEPGSSSDGGEAGSVLASDSEYDD
jgi:hypothetical protein